MKIVATCWLREMFICAEQIYLLERQLYSQVTAELGEDENDIWAKSAIYGGQRGKCNTGIITEKNKE